MKALIAFLLLASASIAYAQDSYDPFRTAGDANGTLHKVTNDYHQQGTADEIYCIMHQSDYGYLLSDSIMILGMDLSDCIDALISGDKRADGSYYCPHYLGSRVDSIIGRHGCLGEKDTRVMIVTAIAVEKQRLSECIEKWNGLLGVYRGNYKPVAVAGQ
jgi:hypothetical protein